MLSQFERDKSLTDTLTPTAWWAYALAVVLAGAWAITVPFLHLVTVDVFSDGKFGAADIIVDVLAQTIPASAVVAIMWHREVAPLRPLRNISA